MITQTYIKYQLGKKMLIHRKKDDFNEEYPYISFLKLKSFNLQKVIFDRYIHMTTVSNARTDDRFA